MFRLFGRRPPQKTDGVDRRSFLKAAGVVATSTALAPMTLLGETPGDRLIEPPRGMSELMRRRSEHGKLFFSPTRTADGRYNYRFEGSVGKIHWRNEVADRWRDIDCTWQQRDWLYRVDSVGYRVTFDPKRLVMTYRSLRGGELRLRLAEIDGKEPRVSAVDQFRPDRFRLRGVADDVDLVVVCRADAPEIYRRITAGRPVIKWEVEDDSAGRIGTNLGKLVGWDNHDLLQTRTSGRRQKLPVEIEYEMSAVVAGSYSVTERLTGRVKIRDPITGVPRWADGLVSPAFLDVTVNENTSQNNDDGQSYDDGTWNWVDGGTYVDWSAFNAPGWRFQTVDVPQGATINSATVSPYVHSADGTMAALFYGQLVPDAEVWTNGLLAGGPLMTKTTSSTSVTGWSTAGVKNINVAAQFQEIVNQGAWAANNDARFAFVDATAGTAITIRTLNYHGSGDAGKFATDYTASGGPAAKRPLMLTGVG